MRSVTRALLTSKVSCTASPKGRAGYRVRKMGPEPSHVQPGWPPALSLSPGSLTIPVLSQVLPDGKKMFLFMCLTASGWADPGRVCRWGWADVQEEFVTPRSYSLPLRVVAVESLGCVWLFWDPMDCNPPGSSVHGIFQARTLEWVAIFFSRRSSWPKDWTHISCIAGRFFTTEPLGKLLINREVTAIFEK